ncbi:glycosyl transferase family 2 [Clostridia bacterium]|nr:glycosyl transferase family 2 [Clostridia bacterium]
MALISAIVPCYNEEEALPHFYEEITKVAVDMPYVSFEFVFVDDGSKDKTMEVVKALREQDERVRYLSFSRNFGKEAAMYAGLREAQGDYVALMDADLQDPPRFLPEMYEGIVNEGYDCVGIRRVTRKGEPPIRSFFARAFYRLINKMSNIEIVDGARDFRLMTRQYVEAVCEVSEYNRFSKGIFSWVGFSTKWLEYENVERVAGSTKWSFWKLFLYSLDGVVAYSTFPLAVSSVIGFVFFMIAIVAFAVFAIKTLIWGDPVAGYPSMMCFILLLGGIQLFSMGILGEYLAKTYLEIKKRPIYVVKEREETQD